MTVTRTYSGAHRALAAVAEAHSLAPMDVRVLVALYESEGVATTVELAAALRVEGSAVRRSMRPLRPDYATGANRRGQTTDLQITDAGRQVAEAFFALLDGLTSTGNPTQDQEAQAA